MELIEHPSTSLAPGHARIPYHLYTDEAIYEREQERIFCGRSWNYVGLEVEIPNPGDFKRTTIGDRPVILVRDKDGSINVVVNKCAHRGVKLCVKEYGNTRSLQCPYHQWNYDLKGNLLGVPFRKGVKGQGGMPPEFDLKDHGLHKLAVTSRHGVIFATFDSSVEPFEAYLGESMLEYFDRVFDGRELRLLGYSRQAIRSNWKLMVENIKDPYHASLLHVFLVTFGLFRADNPSEVRLDEKGRHACLISLKGEQQVNEVTAEMKSFLADFKLQGPELLDPVREFPGNATVVMQTIWPNLIVQQQSNTLAMRQLVTRSPGEFELHWTFFGYASDDEAMVRRRLRQANLMGPSGFVSIDDTEVMELSQKGVVSFTNEAGLLEMGGTDWADTEHMVTEAGIRGFYAYYRAVMEIA